MPNKKRTFKYMAYRTVLKLFSSQIIGAAIYLLMVSLTVILFSDKEGQVKKVFEWIPLVVGVICTMRLVYLHMYRLGEEHYTAGAVVRPPKEPVWGLYVGLFGISPILFFWVLTILGFIFRFPLSSLSSFQNITGYLLYPWSPYFDLIRKIVPNTSFLGVLFYIPPMVPIPLLSYFAFRDGIQDKPMNLKFWVKKHAPTEVNEQNS